MRRLEFVLNRRERILTVTTWAELEASLQTQPITLAFVDPTSDHSISAAEFERVAKAHPSLPIIAYAPITGVAFKAVAQLSRVGLEHVLLYTHDDSADHILAMVDRFRSNPLTDRFIDALRPQLARLPSSISKTVEQMFAEPHRYPSAQDLASAANVSITRLYRAFQAAGLSAPKKMVVASKLLRAFAHLADPGNSVTGVSSKLSYSNPRILGEHTNEVFHLNPSRMRAHFSEGQVIDTLLKYVTRAGQQ